MRKTSIIGITATAVIIISIFLPMLKVGSTSVGLLDAGDRGGKEVAYLIMVLAALMGLCAFLANKKHLASIGTFIFAGLLSAISLKWFKDANEFNASYGMGLILYLLGSLSGVVASILGFMKK